MPYIHKIKVNSNYTIKCSNLYRMFQKPRPDLLSTTCLRQVPQSRPEKRSAGKEIRIRSPLMTHRVAGAVHYFMGFLRVYTPTFLLSKLYDDIYSVSRDYSANTISFCSLFRLPRGISD